MPRKTPYTTERGPPAGTADKPQSGTAAAGDSPVILPPLADLPRPEGPRASFGSRDTLTLSQLRYFMAVCDTLSFTRAARKCGISQPALLRAIRKLENALGARLFRLEPARLRPTELARMLRPQLQIILASAEAAKEAAGKFAAENPPGQNRKRKRRARKT
jgi:transposase-like protein